MFLRRKPPKKTDVLFVPDEVTFSEDDLCAFEEELTWRLSTPMSPYALQRVDKQMAMGFGCIFWHPATSARFEMLDEWWFENEPDLDSRVRGQYPRRRLSSESG